MEKNVYVWKQIITANLQDKASDILYLSYWRQIQWNSQTQQLIDPINQYCLCIQSLVSLIPLCRRAHCCVRHVPSLQVLILSWK